MRRNLKEICEILKVFFTAYCNASEVKSCALPMSTVAKQYDIDTADMTIAVRYLLDSGFIERTKITGVSSYRYVLANKSDIPLLSSVDMNEIVAYAESMAKEYESETSAPDYSFFNYSKLMYSTCFTPQQKTLLYVIINSRQIGLPAVTFEYLMRHTNSNDSMSLIDALSPLCDYYIERDQKGKEGLYYVNVSRVKSKIYEDGEEKKSKKIETRRKSK